VSSNFADTVSSNFADTVSSNFATAIVLLLPIAVADRLLTLWVRIPPGA
jgi:hypothetical protein